MDETRAFTIVVVMAMLIGGALMFRGCVDEAANRADRQQSFRACIAAGKPPLECEKAIP